MRTDLNHDQITMIIERARNERGIAAGRFLATTIHKLLDWAEKGTQQTQQAQARKPVGYHLNSEGPHANAFDTSAFV